ncbi:MAG TPA: hemolysin III family protein [Fimbriimonas sp.]|nr:hemolysin III family protein [Fimbriimonas sp.]
MKPWHNGNGNFYVVRKHLARIKHPFCSISHWIGAVLAVAGAIFLTVMAQGRPLQTVAFLIYGATLIFLYVASGVYHTVKATGKQERLLRNFDHVGIFLLIAGSYVPVCLIALTPALGYTMLVLQAVCATIGILATFCLRKFPEVLNVVLYLLMGWMSLAAIGYMLSHWPSYATGWLVAGGLTYTVGAIIFSLDKPHLVPGKFSAHDLWHVFVLGGSACHFMLMCTYVAKLT